MKNSKLIEILRTFDPNELSRFDDFVSSPFYNKHSKATVLYKKIAQYAPSFDNKRLEKSQIYRWLYPDKSYNDKIMRNIMSELVKLAEKFLEIKNYEEKTGERYNYLLQELLKKKLYGNFEKNYYDAQEFLNKSHVNEQNYYNILNLNSLKHSCEVRRGHKLETTPDSSVFLDPLFAFFSMFFFKANYNLATRKGDYNFSYNFTSELKFIDSLLEYVKQKKMKSEPIILTYYYSLMLFIKPEDDSFFLGLRDLISKYKDSFSILERRNFHYAQASYCNRKTAGGDRNYIYTAFEIYQEMVHEKTYSYDESDNMHPVIYKNIVKQGVMAKEFDWTLKFIEEFKSKLTVGLDLNLYNYSNALLYFKKREFHQSLEFLSKVNYENVKDKLDVKCLLIQQYYELDSHENLLSQIDAFKHFLNNDKLLSKEVKDVHMNFIKFVNKLINTKFKIRENHNLAILKKEVIDTITYDKGWLTQKIEERQEENEKSASSF